MCKCTINQKTPSKNLEDYNSIFEFIRAQNLTGTKRVCGTGVCGACAVEIDGKTINSCIAPTNKADKKDIITIEHYSDIQNLHPIQKAFIDHDAMQCGFCTPGFVIESINFYNNWKKENNYGNKPTKDAVAAALSGHLCRCGAYPNIYSAVQEACAGKYDAKDAEFETHRYDAVEKVTGKAKYTYDMVFEDQLEVYFVRSVHPYAEIKNINTEELTEIEGVYAALDLLKEDKKVRYVGQAILALAIENKAAIEKIEKTLMIHYETLPFVTKHEDAKQENSTLVYTKEEHGAIHDSSEGFLIPGKWKGNIREAVTLSSVKRSKAESVIEMARKLGSPYLVEHTYKTAAQIHTPLEPHICVANYLAEDRLDVYLSTQGVHEAAESLAKKLGLPKENVRVIAEYIGGGFGSKLALGEEAIVASKLALLTKRPVRAEFTRNEELSVGGIRAASEMDLAMVADKDGKLEAFSIDCYSFSGIGVGYTSMPFIKNIYGSAPRSLRDLEVVTNESPARPFRAPGAPRIFFAVESAVDEMAHILGKDPIKIRLDWDINENNRKLLELAAETDIWKTRNTFESEETSERFVKGVGIATAVWPYFYESFGTAKLIASKNGLYAEAGIQDIGTGSKTVVRNAIFEYFNIPQKKLTIAVGDSEYVPGVTSGGSMTTPSTYYAVVKACRALQEELCSKLNSENCTREGIQIGEEFVNWVEAFAKLDTDVIVEKERGKDKVLDHKVLSVLTGKNSSSNVVVSEVEVDKVLNTFRVTRVWSGVSAGKIVSKKLAENQIYGGIIQGLGYALFEKKIIENNSGRNLTNTLETYKIPGIGDTPEIEVEFFENGHDHVKGQAIGLAEIVTVPVAGSIANAIFNATGKRQTNLPINFESIYENK